MLRLLSVLVVLTLIANFKGYAQSCNCQEYIYLNEPDISSVIKFRVNSDGSLTEVLGVNGGTMPTQHWYPGTSTSELPQPHGLGWDLNGNLYIGANSNSGSQIRKFNCDGVLSPVDGNTITHNDNLFNIFSIGNILFATGNNGPRVYNTCNGDEIGQVCFNDLNGNPLMDGDWAWGLSYNESTQMVYATKTSGSSKAVYVFSKAQLEASIDGNPCINPFITPGADQTMDPGDNYLPSNAEFFGITSDNSGNFYIVTFLNGIRSQPRILKYNAAGQFVAITTITPKMQETYGITWSEDTNTLYVANRTDDDFVDCISAIDPVTMTYLFTAAPNPQLPVNNSAKALSIIKECCPTTLPSPFEKNVCGATGTKFYLNQEAFNTCDGIVCGSSWTPVGTLNGMTFDDCDNSVTITGLGCSTFTLNLSAVTSTNCSARNATFTICNTSASATVTPVQGTCTGSSPNNDARINITAASNTNQAGISTGATYTGPAYNGAGTVAVTGGTASFTGRMHNTQYTVRIFNGSNDCFRDYTVTTPTLTCTPPTGDCNCKDYIYLNEVQGGGVVYKFEVNPITGALTEIQNNGDAWYPGGGVSELGDPHGLGYDLNGNLYIGASVVGPIRQLNCVGEITPVGSGPNFGFPNGGFNIRSIGNTLYVNTFTNPDDARITAYDLCTGQPKGFILLAGNPANAIDWGFHIDENGKFYITSGFGTGENALWVVSATDADFINNTSFNPLITTDAVGSDPAVGEMKLPGGDLRGITTDEDGNIYMALRDAHRIYKYSPTGAFIARSAQDVLQDGIGFFSVIGLVYSKASGRIYSSNFTNLDDCISTFDKDLNYLGAGVPVVPGSTAYAKSIGLIRECCPTAAQQTFNQTVCSNGNGEKIFLQDVLSCGDGIVCEGMWTEVANNSNGTIVFNECDLSIIVNGSGCATYNLVSTGGGRKLCPAFNITLNVCTQVPSASVTTNTGTCTSGNPNNNASISITSVVNANAANYSTGSTYTGPAFGGSGQVAISGGSGVINGLMHNTQYTVRVFNGSNDCYIDFTVSTPSIQCPTCNLTVQCNPTPQSNCSPVNGSANVTVSGGQGTITYLWSSGEPTSNITGKAAGSYTVTVTDSFEPGCTAVCVANIANNANAPTCVVNVNIQPSCANLTGGDITVVPNPAGTYSFNWNDIGIGSATRTGLTGGTYTVTVTNTTTNCTGVCNVTLTTPTNCCNINAIVTQNVVCVDNGTPALLTDNRIQFSANVTNTNTSLTSYNVAINGGTTITPNTNVPYGVTQFLLGPGTAGGGATFTVTVTDSATPGCTQTVQILDPGGCNNTTPCPTPKCGAATIQVNGN